MMTVEGTVAAGAFPIAEANVRGKLANINEVVDINYPQEFVVKKGQNPSKALMSWSGVTFLRAFVPSGDGWTQVFLRELQGKKVKSFVFKNKHVPNDTIGPVPSMEAEPEVPRAEISRSTDNEVTVRRWDLKYAIIAAVLAIILCLAMARN